MYDYVDGDPLRFGDPAGTDKVEMAKVLLKYAQQGKVIRNMALAGTEHPVTKVPFNKFGFPDFSNWTKATVDIGKFTTRKADEVAANAAAGLKETPRGYVWHHVEDLHTMQLVQKEIHDATGHTGGFALKGSAVAAGLATLMLPLTAEVIDTSECADPGVCPSPDELQYKGAYSSPQELKGLQRLFSSSGEGVVFDCHEVAEGDCRR